MGTRGPKANCFSMYAYAESAEKDGRTSTLVDLDAHAENKQIPQHAMSRIYMYFCFTCCIQLVFNVHSFRLRWCAAE